MWVLYAVTCIVFQIYCFAIDHDFFFGVFYFIIILSMNNYVINKYNGKILFREDIMPFSVIL